MHFKFESEEVGTVQQLTVPSPYERNDRQSGANIIHIPALEKASPSSIIQSPFPCTKAQTSIIARFKPFEYSLVRNTWWYTRSYTRAPHIQLPMRICTPTSNTRTILLASSFPTFRHLLLGCVPCISLSAVTATCFRLGLPESDTVHAGRFVW